ncbi:MAG: hypothetical protein ABUL50_09125, partial [Rhizobacter sp.]
VPPVAEVLREFPSRRVATEQGDLTQGLTVRLQLHRVNSAGSASGELDLGDSARFYPTDAALDRWRAGAHRGEAVVVYE